MMVAPDFNFGTPCTSKPSCYAQNVDAGFIPAWEQAHKVDASETNVDAGFIPAWEQAHKVDASETNVDAGFIPAWEQAQYS